MNPELIKAYLRMAGYTLADIAREHRVGESSVRLALRRSSVAGAKAIACVMKKLLHELWPDR